MVVACEIYPTQMTTMQHRAPLSVAVRPFTLHERLHRTALRHVEAGFYHHIVDNFECICDHVDLFLAQSLSDGKLLCKFQRVLTPPHKTAVLDVFQQDITVVLVEGKANKRLQVLETSHHSRACIKLGLVRIHAIEEALAAEGSGFVRSNAHAEVLFPSICLAAPNHPAVLVRVEEIGAHELLLAWGNRFEACGVVHEQCIVITAALEIPQSLDLAHYRFDGRACRQTLAHKIPHLVLLLPRLRPPPYYGGQPPVEMLSE